MWKELEVAVGKSSIVKVGDRLYCPDDAGKMWVLDAKTGVPVGRKISVGTINFATPLAADGKIYHLEKNGRWYIFTPDEKEGCPGPFAAKLSGIFPFRRRMLGFARRFPRPALYSDDRRAVLL